MDKHTLDQPAQNKRRLLAAVFVALCLGLSGLLLRRQIAAHPAPPQATPIRTANLNPRPMNYVLPSPDPQQWHAETGPIKKAVIGSIKTQLAAIRTGDAEKAIFYQSSGLRRNFASPLQFVQIIRAQYPEFGQSRSVQFGPVLVDKSRNFAQVVVTTLGDNGRKARGGYFMVKEDGIYKVAGVGGGHALK